MDWRDFISMVLVVFLSLWGMLYLESDLASYFMLELLALLIFIIIASGLLYGAASGKDWAMPGLAVFFAAALANTIIVFLATGKMTPFILTLIVNLVGFSICTVQMPNAVKLPKNKMPKKADEPEEEISIPDLPKLPDRIPDDPMPIYHIDESDLIDHIDIEETEPSTMVELETYKDESAVKRVAPMPVFTKFSKKKSSAGKKKSANKSAKKKKR